MAVQTVFARILAAAPPSTWEQIKRVPKETWINLVICLVAVVVIVWVWKGLKKFNDFAPYIAVLLAAGLIFFYWIYDRSEPRFLTPVIDKLAPFFPTKGSQPGSDNRRNRDPL
jgi:hypothetical protein